MKVGMFLLGMAVVVTMAQVTQTPGGVYTPAWDDLVSPAGAINPLGADGQMTEITDAADYIGCLQADAVGETAVIQWQLSHSTRDNTDMHPHIHFLKNDVSDNTGTVLFEAKFRHCPLTGACGAWTAFSAGTPELVAGDTAGAQGLVEWILADSTYNFGISDVILMQVKRTGGTSGSVAVCTADLHFQKDTLGSRTEYAR